jgi:hypothetical protein
MTMKHLLLATDDSKGEGINESALAEVLRLKAQLGEYSRKMIDLADEIIAWKDATGLERGGDPDGVTPDDLREEIAHLRTTDEALCSRYEVVIRDLMDACDRMMGDSDLPDDESFEVKAMRRAAAVLKDRVEIE